MKRTETAEEFYRNRYPGFPANGQFNVFERGDQAGAPLPYSRRDFFKVSYVTGTGRLLYANKEILIDRPALLFSNPMIPYSWEALSNDQGGYMCIFTEAFLKTKDRNVFLGQSPFFKVNADNVFFLNEKQQVFVKDVFSNMLSEIQSTYSHKYDLLINYINLLLHEAMKMQPEKSMVEPKNASSRITGMFFDLVQRQFPIMARDQQVKFKTAAQYADQLCVHVNHLNHAIREVTGKTTSDHIKEAVLNEAKALLTNTDWSVGDIAWCLGFDSASYFHNYFKRNTGIVPKQARSISL